MKELTTTITVRKTQERFVFPETGVKDVLCIEIEFEGQRYLQLYDGKLPALPFYIEMLLDDEEFEDAQERAAARRKALGDIKDFDGELTLDEVAQGLISFRAGWQATRGI